MNTHEKFRAVRFDHYGEIDVLHIEELALPVPGENEVLIKVRAAGINPGEAAIRQGLLAKQWPAVFPSGQGSDFAGIVERTGASVSQFKPGDEVIGFTNKRASQAEYVVADAADLVRRPPHVSWEQAGGLFVVGTTAFAAIRAVGLKTGETLVVSGAAGGVGSVTVQLARNAGAKVIGLAGESNHPWLKQHGVIPVAYGEGMVERIRKTADGKIDAFIDTYGHGYVDIALSLGVSPERIDTIIDFDAAKKHHTRTEGNAAGARAEVMAELAGLIEKGRLEIPIAKVYNLNQVRDAFRELEMHHTHGKIVLVP
jgi:NADPH:quinone reductase-like Zn-dependent oxidoreductase